MEKTKNLTQIVLAGAISVVLSACVDWPKVEKCEDLTGDGITDIMICNDNGAHYLFIGKEDGTFLSSKKRYTRNRDNPDKVTYFIAEDKTAYFFNGKFYQKAEKETEQQ